MNQEFARRITLLRKEKKLSQKEAAQALGISQALLSHYEKGIRECGLDFVVKAAEFYGVSCDYLLGKTAERQYDITELESDTAHTKQNAANLINRRLLDNTAGILYDMLAKVGSRKLTRSVTAYLMLAYYKAFRYLYHGNAANPDGLFTVPKQLYRGYTSAAQEKLFTDLESINNPNSDSDVPKLRELCCSPEQITEDYPETASSLFNVIQHAENAIGKIK